MAKRHQEGAGDWQALALRLDELITAHSGEDSFQEAWKLLVARLVHADTSGSRGFLADTDRPAAEVSALLDQARNRWPGLLEPDAACRLSAPELHRAAALLRDADLRADDLVGLDAIFEFIVSRAAKGQKGQFFTPRGVVDDVVTMMSPRAGERVADPACGSGAFLRHALRNEPRCEVYGFDQDSRAVQVAKTMLAASEQPCGRVVRLDSLRRPSKAESIESCMRRAGGEPGFDLVLTNPPFAGDVGESFRELYELAAPGRVERDVLFLERCVELLRPGGRLAIVLPHNKVGSARWAFVRRWLLLQTRVVAVLGLKRDTFLPHTSQKTCVIVAVRRRVPLRVLDEREPILFFVDDDGLGQAVPAVREGLALAEGA